MDRRLPGTQPGGVDGGLLNHPVICCSPSPLLLPGSSSPRAVYVHVYRNEPYAAAAAFYMRQ